MSGDRSVLGDDPTVLMLGDREADLSARALVVGVIDTAARSLEAILATAHAHFEAGADMLELVPCPADDVIGALQDVGELPIAVCTDDVAELRGALDAGAVVARTGAPPSHEFLDTVAVRGAVIVVTDPAGDIARLASTSGVDDVQVVLEVRPDGFGEAALIEALHSVPHVAARGHAVAFICDSDSVAITWAVARGARLVYTRDVAPAARVVRTLAAINEPQEV